MAYDIFGYLLPGFFVAISATYYVPQVNNIFQEIWKTGLPYNLIVTFIVVYTLGHVLSGISSYLLERLLVRKLVDYPTSHMFRESEIRLKWLKDFLFPGYYRPYSKPFQSQVKKLYEQKFGFVYGDVHDLFWCSWCFIALHHPTSFKRATHFLELYGFSRNICFAILLQIFIPILNYQLSDARLWGLTLILLALSYIMFVNYLKLLRRLNDEVYRAFVVAATNPLISNLKEMPE